MNNRKIERNDGRGLGRQQLLAYSIEIFISHEKKKWLVAARNLQSIKTLLALELSQYRKSGSMFYSSELVAARSDCSRLGNTLCLCLPVWPAQAEAAEQESGPKSLAVDFALLIFDYPLEQPSKRLPDDLQGLELWLKLELCRLTK